MDRWVNDEYRDEVTGMRVEVLTPGPARDQVVYQTHPMWTRGMRRLLFHSDRTGIQQPHGLDIETGKICCLVDREAGPVVLARQDDLLYFRSGGALFAADVNAAFEDPSGTGHVADLPAFIERIEGGLSLDADEETLYTGAVLQADREWALLALDLRTAGWRVVVRLDFRIGHVQANPVTPGVVMFCHETGGESPQRMWVVSADGTGLRPFYRETYNEWVTHEVWWGADRAIFTIFPYDEEHLRLPHGVVSADLETGTPTVHGEFKAWHTHGAPGGRLAVADDFERGIWLIDTVTGERRLLTQGHNSEGFNTHPHPSFTPDGKAVLFNSSRRGAEEICLVEIA